MPPQRDPNFSDQNLIADLRPLITMDLWAPLFGPVDVALFLFKCYYLLMYLPQTDVDLKS